MNTDDQFEKLLVKRSANIKKIAEGTTGVALGKHAVALIARDGEISVETLKNFLLQELENSPSAQGLCDADQDFKRQSAEESLKHLETLLLAHAR